MLQEVRAEVRSKKRILLFLAKDVRPRYILVLESKYLQRTCRMS